jgi:hypothetical protein
MRGKHPSLGSGDEVGVLQLLGVVVFNFLQGFGNGSLTAFCSGCSGLCFSELHVELPGVDLGLLGMVDIVSQSGGLLVVLLVEGKQVVGHVLHGGAVLLLLQGFHVGDLGEVVRL